MKKIDALAANAFVNGVDYHNGVSSVTGNCPQTTVTVKGGFVTMKLHGHVIAKREERSKKAELTLAGHGTLTTRNRLTAIMKYTKQENDKLGFVGFSQYKGKQIFTPVVDHSYEIDKFEVVTVVLV